MTELRSTAWSTSTPTATFAPWMASTCESAPGERVALVGQNGSGKTTLVRHFNGLLRPTSGTVLVDGGDAGALTVAQLAARVGLVFQDPDRQIFAGSVRAEVEFGPRNLGRSGDELRAAVTDALATTGLAGEEATNPYDLGQSRRKLLALASVLAMRTPVLVLDEPTTGQDARGVERVRAVVEAVAAEGRTVVAISHDMRFVAEVFERVIVMRAGRIVLDGAPARGLRGRCVGRAALRYLEPPLRRASVSGWAGIDADRRCLIDALRRRRPPSRPDGEDAERRLAPQSWPQPQTSPPIPDTSAGECIADSFPVEAGRRRQRGCPRRRVVSSLGRSSRCSRSPIGPGIGSAMTECGTSSSRSVIPRNPRRRSAAAKRSAKSWLRIRLNASDEWARFSSSIPRGGFHRVHLVEAELALEDVERPICLLARRPAEMRRTVDEQAGAIQRFADAGVAIEVALSHGPNTTR